MRGLRSVLHVVVEIVEVDIEGLESLYTVCKEVFSDDLVDAILDKAPVMEAWKFCKHTGRGQKKMFTRFLKMDMVVVALDFMDETCDKETYVSVLSAYHDVDRYHQGVHRIFLSKMDMMKRLGYKREIHLFEAVLHKSHMHLLDAEIHEKLFREMVEENPHIAAKPSLYQAEIERYARLSFKHFVGMQAKAKGIHLNFDKFLEGDFGDTNSKMRLDLLRDVVHEPSEACACSAGDIVSALEGAVDAGLAIDPAANVRIDWYDFAKQKKAFLEKGTRSGLLRMSDKNLKSLLRNQWRMGLYLLQLASRHTSRPFPTSLNYIVNRGPLRIEDLVICFESLYNLARPDKQTCDKRIPETGHPVQRARQEDWRSGYFLAYNIYDVDARKFFQLGQVPRGANLFEVEEPVICSTCSISVRVQKWKDVFMARKSAYREGQELH